MSQSSVRSVDAATGMTTSGPTSRFWPYTAKRAILLTPILLIFLLAAWGVGRERLHFDEAPAGWVLLGVALLSIFPVLLVVLDGLAVSGGSIEVGTVKLEVASSASAISVAAHIVPSNVTQQREVPLQGSGSSQILDALKGSSAADVVIVDLEDGHAWWETRLLILCAGATRLGRPRVIVFTAMQEGQRGRFAGWGRPRDLRDRLLDADEGYRRALEEANGLAIAARLQQANTDPPSGPAPVAVNIRSSKIAMVRKADGSLNPFLDEQLLADTLGRRERDAAREIDVDRLRSLFLPVLRTSSIDKTQRDEDWIRSVLLHDHEYIAVTDGGRYVAMMSRAEIVNTLLRALTQA